MLTRTRLATCVSLFLLLFFWHVPNASAYRIAFGLNYDAPSGQLSGFSATWKDWWDEDAGEDCSYYDYDPEYEYWYCASWVYWENWASVVARLYTPSVVSGKVLCESR